MICIAMPATNAIWTQRREKQKEEEKQKKNIVEWPWPDQFERLRLGRGWDEEAKEEKRECEPGHLRV